MKCKNCNHMGWNRYEQNFYCEETKGEIVDINANLNCPYAEEVPKIDSFKKGCMWCVYQTRVDYDRYNCSKLKKSIKSSVLDGKKCRSFVLFNDNVRGCV